MLDMNILLALERGAARSVIRDLVEDGNLGTALTPEVGYPWRG